MADLPKIVLDEDVLYAILGMKAAERRLVLKLLEEIQRSFWKEDADYVISDSVGRYLSVKAVRPFLVTYWHDSPVDEIRIIGLERVRS